MDKEYYDRIVKLCAEENVQLIAVLPPKFSIAKEQASHWETMVKYFNDNSIDYFDYNNYQSAQRMDMDWENEYFDVDHLNYVGAIKWSKYLAHDLKEKIVLPDHRREDSDYQKQMEQWNQEFKRIYDPLISEEVKGK